MKLIFNWVHRKFHLNVDNHSFSPIKDGVGENAKKPETVTTESDTDALLDHFTLSDVHDGWKDGLLSIGTFGFDPLELYNHFNGDFVQQTDDDAGDGADEEEGKEELKPLVVKGFKGEFDKELVSSSASARKPDLSTTVDDEDIDTPLLQFLKSPENSASEEKDKKIKKGERTTLADLFSADADTTAATPENSDSSVVHQPGRLEKTSCRKNHGLSFTTKFLSRKGDDSLPITILYRSIKKMLKKKIHPELEGKVHGMNSPIINLESEKGEGHAGSNESLSLLQGCEMDS